MADEIASLNADIAKALKGTGYTMANSTERIFFDWDGNVVINDSTPKIGGQGASPSLGLVAEGTTTKISLKNSTGEWSLA